jgi:hypothetical protein
MPDREVQEGLRSALRRMRRTAEVVISDEPTAEVTTMLGGHAVATGTTKVTVRTIGGVRARVQESVQNARTAARQAVALARLAAHGDGEE